MKAAWCISLLLGGGLTTARVAFQEGRFEEAWQDYDAEVRAQGSEASAALLYNRALAALQAGHLQEAEVSAELAAARGGAAFQDRRTFLLGCADLARAERLAARASQPGAPPSLYDAAIQLAVEARSHWIQAAEGQTEWPAAVRNVERAQRRIRQWEESRDQAAREQPPPPEQDQPPDQPPEDPESPPETPDTLPPQEEPGALTAEEVQRLREQLLQKEQEKLMRRRARREASAAAVEKDW